MGLGRFQEMLMGGGDGGVCDPSQIYTPSKRNLQTLKWPFC